MGAFLDKPLTDKTCDSQEANGMRAYSCSMQGWRITMEVSSSRWYHFFRMLMWCAQNWMEMRKLPFMVFLIFRVNLWKTKTLMISWELVVVVSVELVFFEKNQSFFGFAWKISWTFFGKLGAIWKRALCCYYLHFCALNCWGIKAQWSNFLIFVSFF